MSGHHGDGLIRAAGSERSRGLHALQQKGSVVCSIGACDMQQKGSAIYSVWASEMQHRGFYTTAKGLLITIIMYPISVLKGAALFRALSLHFLLDEHIIAYGIKLFHFFYNFVVL